MHGVYKVTAELTKDHIHSPE